ncbi:MAG: hypothetical protein F6K48_29350 [Okeania sp. SIO3H1]|nr:hypothetical protein [Okeania sp. SIO3H1]
MPTTNFDRLTEASVNKLPIGLYAHSGDRYPGLKLNVGKRRSTWYLRERVGDKFKSAKLGSFPDITLKQAVALSEKQAVHQSNETTATIKTVRDAWAEYRKGSTSKVNTLTDQESKLERYAGHIMNKSPAQVSLLDVRQCLLAIPSVSTRHHVKAALNVQRAWQLKHNKCLFYEKLLPQKLDLLSQLIL